MRCKAWILMPWLLLSLGAAWAQGIDIPGVTSDDPAPEEWTPPDPIDLGSEWWLEFQTDDAEEFRRRGDLALETIQSRVGDLGPDAIVAGRNLMNALAGNLELLHAGIGQKPTIERETLSIQDDYTLDGYLQLRAQWRQRRDRQQTLQTEINQLQRQLVLVEQRQDALLRRYNASDAQSPERILLGIERMLTRSERALLMRQIDRRESLIQQNRDRQREIAQLLDYAREHLAPAEPDAEAHDASIAEIDATITEMSERRNALQRSIVESVEEDGEDGYREMLLKQQLSLSGAQEDLAQLQRQIVELKYRWAQLQSGLLPPEFDLVGLINQQRQQTASIAAQIDLWVDASESTLVTPAPSDSPPDTYVQAQQTARETLAMVGDIRARLDDVGRLQALLTEDVAGSQSGLRGWWTRASVVLGAFWDQVNRVLTYDLFRIGDTPVTPFGILKLVLILGFAWALSWFIRHGLERLRRRRKLANSAAVYTLGRVLHYIIISVALLAALASMGLDFTSIALIAGALSVGIGFGLQSIVNNFVSGLILLFEGTLKVGDYIEIQDGLTGTVREINTRATRINTNDNIDVVVPNSELVSNRLTNWTLRESVARMRIGFGVAYGSNKEEVRRAALEAADKVSFTLKTPPGRPPEVWLVNFGDSSLDFELLVWVTRQGVTRPQRVRSAYLWEIETQLKERGIEIPFPQRDLHLRSDFRHPQAATDSEDEGTTDDEPGAAPA